MKSESRRWRILGRVLLFMIGCAIVLMAITPLVPKGQAATSELFTGLMASLGAFGLTLLFVRWEGLRLDDVGVSPDRRSLLRFAIGFLFGAILVALNSTILWGVGHVRWVRTSDIGFSDVMITLVAYLCLAVREDLAFHGYPLRRLKPSFGLWGAQLIVAFIFALEHVAGGSTLWLALLGAGVGSLLFGMAAIATRGIALPIDIHAAWNIGDWMRGGKGTVGFWKPVVEDGFKERAAFVGIASYVLVMCLAILAFWWWYRCVERNNASGTIERVG
jgi:membrane protease YdiL (CAAX protease family)